MPGRGNPGAPDWPTSAQVRPSAPRNDRVPWRNGIRRRFKRPGVSADHAGPQRGVRGPRTAMMNDGGGPWDDESVRRPLHIEDPVGGGAIELGLDDRTAPRKARRFQRSETTGLPRWRRRGGLDHDRRPLRVEPRLRLRRTTRPPAPSPHRVEQRLRRERAGGAGKTAVGSTPQREGGERAWPLARGSSRSAGRSSPRRRSRLSRDSPVRSDAAPAVRSGSGRGGARRRHQGARVAASSPGPSAHDVPSRSFTCFPPSAAPASPASDYGASSKRTGVQVSGVQLAVS
jgi:hypothetical protein